MPSTNGHGPKRAILYARVSTDEQATKGYSLAGQLEELRKFATAEGYQVLKEVVDPGEKRWTLDRPGIHELRELVSPGGVDAVLAWQWDRFGEFPHPEILALEFEEYGTMLRSLDDSGEGEDAELLRVLKGQLAKRERSKTVARSRMGKLQKVREGKLLASQQRPKYGFRFNEARDGYEVDDAKMVIVRRIIGMVAGGTSGHGVQETLEREGTPAPAGGKRWSRHTIRNIVFDDCYRPHTFDEVSALVRRDVAALLDPEQCYGISWWGKRRTKYTARKKRVAEMKDRSEWVAVPVPDAGIPREVVDAARAAIKDNQPCSSAGGRFWELSGGIFVCGVCGQRMVANRKKRSPDSDRWHLYYRCSGRKGTYACPNRRSVRAEETEAQVWEFVSGLMEDPDRLREDLERMIEEESKAMHRDPDREARAWFEKLAEVDRKRSKFQDMAAEGLISFDELKTKLTELDEVRLVARREIDTLEYVKNHIAHLQSDKQSLLESFAQMAPEALAALTPEERHRFYGLLRLRVLKHQDGTLEASGAFGAGASVCKASITYS